MKDIYAMWKTHWSRPVDEDNITMNLAFEVEEIFCGIDKRFESLYDIGHNPIIKIKEQEVDICKNCFKSWKKKIDSHTKQTKTLS